MDDTHLFLEPSLNPEIVAMLAEELITHFNRHRRTADFANTALVFVACEHRLTDFEELVRMGDKRMDMLWDEIRARKA